MKRFTQVRFVCIGLLVAGFTLFISFSDVSAREPRPGFVSPIDGMVGGEPGEDPHLRIPTKTTIEPIWSPEGSGGGGSQGFAVIGGAEVLIAEDSDAPCGTDCMASWWRMFLHILSRVLSR